MAKLSAPTVSEPLYERASTVVLTGYVPGATLEIYADPPGPGPAVKVGGGVSNSASGQVFGVAPANMVAGAKITAVQIYLGDKSPPSPEVTVQTALGVDAPILTAPLLECAGCTAVGGLLPGVQAEVRDAGTTVGKSSAAGPTISVAISPPFKAGHTITARQVYCSSPGPDSPGLLVGAVKEQKIQLAPPEVDAPLFACQQSCGVWGCMPGCQVELFVNGAVAAAGCASSPGVSLGVGGGFLQGTSITARQSLCGGMIQSTLSAAVVVQPAANIPTPVIWPPLYEGDTSVLVGMTVAGEIVAISADGGQIGMGAGGGGNALLNVDPPLAAKQKIVATVELCKIEKTSLPVTVLPAPMAVPPPKIVQPLVDCSLSVDVIACIPGAEVRVFAEFKGNTVLIGLAKTLGTAVTVWVTPPLKVDYLVHATQKAGGIVSKPSEGVPVEPAPATTPPSLITPILACSRCVGVEKPIAGARIDVYQNNIWLGGAWAGGAVTHVSVYPGLTAGTVTATQTVCGKVSQPAQADVSPAPEELPAPQLLPAFANKAYVTATNLTPGAMVEVEELDVYKQVIGKSCAGDKTAAVGLNLPLFAGARLRASQRLCNTSPWSKTIEVGQPEEWPLGAGPFKAGFRLVSDVPLSPDISFLGASSQCNGGTYDFVKPVASKAVIHYPAAADGQDAPFAAGGPFPIIIVGHGRRNPSCVPNWQACPGAPTDIKEDYRQLSGILSHLARWGFVSIAPDIWWLASTFGGDDWDLVLADAIPYIIAENTKSGSPFKGKLKTTEVALMGHSTSGAASIRLAGSGKFSVAALALLAPASGAGTVASLAPKPIIVFHGTQDVGPFGDQGQSVNVYSAAGPRKHMVTLGGGNHFGFCDSLCILNDPPGTLAQADQQRITKAYLTAFFRRYLNGVGEVEDYLTGIRQVEELEAFTITVNAQLS